MALTVKELKEAVENLSPDAFGKFATWVYNLAERRDYEELADHTKGISLREVLRAFKRELPITKGRIDIWEAGIAGTCMGEFYEKTRVQGCAFENDADMLLAQWGPEGKKEFRLAYTRQLIPPLPNGDDQIWQLTLDMRFPMSDKLKKLGSGNRWFRSLRDHQKFLEFTICSRVGTAVDKLKPSRVLLSYQNVE
jgi:hypothetical protein